ncbi:unnamed protein product [Lepeophtheirus salmonis]|uniref:(salmon louse) hypothetical protein n=1 Tax=Lepeophtheirus salmonis TaxID=72036 RepID=A0A7R8HB87_LEPSM|nr:unnamed protein product [Lepeophtheirus salmonis]CAF2988592.1 unnamed protein product [Lepeophtheirus salmonis]
MTPNGLKGTIKVKVLESWKKQMVITWFDNKVSCQKACHANPEWFLHMDNCSSHTAINTKEFITTSSIRLTDHSAHSTDLTPEDIFLFPNAKELWVVPQLLAVLSG